MSRVGKSPINIPNNVKVDFEGLNVKVEGPKGNLEKSFLGPVTLEKSENSIIVNKKDDSKFARSLHGTVRQIINNMILGVTQGYSKSLSIEGIGFKASLQGPNLNLALGYSHPITVMPEKNIKFSLEGNTIIVSGIDKEAVGRVAALIKSKRKPDPYKGKGVRYTGEKIRMKEGKKS